MFVKFHLKQSSSQKVKISQAFSRGKTKFAGMKINWNKFEPPIYCMNEAMPVSSYLTLYYAPRYMCLSSKTHSLVTG